MKRTRFYRNTLSMLFFALYVLVSSFGVNIHHHAASQESQDHHFSSHKKPQISKNSSGADCLVCHNFYFGSGHLPLEFSYTLHLRDPFVSPDFVFKNACYSLFISYVNLRGPPVL